MSERLEHRPADYINVLEGGELIYIGFADRAAFDRIALPCTDHGEKDHGHVLTKSLDAGGIYIVFQYFLKSRTIEAIRADYATPGGAKP
jgi:hypothetical protein